MSRFSPPARGRCTLLLVPLLCLACGDDGSGDAVPVPEAIPLQVEPLDDDDLAGLEPTKVAVNMPWGGGVVSRDPVPSAARATLLEARTEEHGAFDRLVLEFGSEAPFPGYRVTRTDSAAVECGTGAPALDPGAPRPLLVRLRPAQAHDVDRGHTLRDPERRLGFPAMKSARQLCDEAGLVEWLIEVADSTSVRVLEMRDPPRLVVDVAHPGTLAPSDTAAGAAGAASDTAAGAATGGG